MLKIWQCDGFAGIGALDSVPVGQKQGFFAMQFSSFDSNLPPENDPLMFSSCLPS